MALGATKNKSAFGSTYRRVVLIGDEGLGLYAIEKKKAIRVLALPWTAENFDEQVTNALKREFKGPVVILFDAVEQHYRKDKLPKVGGFDKSKVLKRKLSLAFPNFTMTAALELKDKKSKGLNIALTSAQIKQPEYLFAALPKSENLDRVTRILFDAEVSILGLGLLPVESVGLVEEISERCALKAGVKRSKWSILIGHDETGGLRQIVTKDGQLALTRLTPISEAALKGGISAEIIREFQATLSYIARFGYGQNDGLDVTIIADRDSHNPLKVANLPVTNLHCLDLSQAVTLLGGQYVGQATSTYADALHALWVAKKFKLDMPIKVPAINKISAPRTAAKALIAATTVSALVLCWFVFQSYSEYSETVAEIETKTTQKNALTREYSEESKVFDTLPVRPEVVNGTLDVKKMLQDNSVDLTPVMQTLKDKLGSGFLVNTLSIKHKAAEGSALESVQANARPGGFRAAIGNVINQSKADKERGEVEMTFSVYLVKQLELEDRVIKAEELLETLTTAFPDHDVELTQQFSGISRTGSYTGSVGGQAPQQQQAPQNDLAEFKITGAPL
jgi:hypothetical protein